MPIKSTKNTNSVREGRIQLLPWQNRWKSRDSVKSVYLENYILFQIRKQLVGGTPRPSREHYDLLQGGVLIVIGFLGWGDVGCWICSPRLSAHWRGSTELSYNNCMHTQCCCILLKLSCSNLVSYIWCTRGSRVFQLSSANWVRFGETRQKERNFTHPTDDYRTQHGIRWINLKSPLGCKLCASKFWKMPLCLAILSLVKSSCISRSLIHARRATHFHISSNT